MDKLKIINGQLFEEKPSFINGTVYVVKDRIVSASDYENFDAKEIVLDAYGSYVIPGLTDIHFHGAMGSDCCDGTLEAFRTMAKYELSQGITQITPATMTISEDQLSRICQTAADYSCSDGADFLGLYMEGPFISHQKKGAQNEQYIRKADTALLKKFQKLSGNRIKTVIVAPETENAMEFIRDNRESLNISIGHTMADYETAKEAIHNGASELTHMFNAMPPFLHRAPGPVGAAADDDHCMVEMICDGVHLHPAVVRTAFKIFGDRRIILISDSMRAAGLADGTYDLGGQEVTVHGSLAALSDGTIAGSVTCLMDCLRHAVKDMQIPLASAVRCASLNPAHAIGVDQDYGSLAIGKIANLVLLDSELRIQKIVHHGVLQ